MWWGKDRIDDPGWESPFVEEKKMIEYPQEPICGYCHEKIAAHACPGKVGSLKNDQTQLQLQIDDLRKRYTSMDLRCLELIAEKDVANRLNGELKAVIRDMTSYVERSGDWIIARILYDKYLVARGLVEVKQPEKRIETPPIEKTRPIGNCKRCGIAIYTEQGFCGGCVR